MDFRSVNRSMLLKDGGAEIQYQNNLNAMWELAEVIGKLLAAESH